MNQPFPNGPASAISHHEEVAQIIAQQSIADSLRRAWRYATTETRQAFAHELFQWALRYVCKAEDRNWFIADIVRSSFESLREHISEDMKRELATAIAERIVRLMRSEKDLSSLSWDERNLLTHSLVCAARTEVLAAAGRELSVEAMAGKEAPP